MGVTIILSLFLLSGTAWACKSTKTEVGNIGSGPRGQMTSPNFTTGNYPNSFHESNTIRKATVKGWCLVLSQRKRRKISKQPQPSPEDSGSRGVHHLAAFYEILHRFNG